MQVSPGYVMLCYVMLCYVFVYCYILAYFVIPSFHIVHYTMGSLHVCVDGYC